MPDSRVPPPALQPRKTLWERIKDAATMFGVIASAVVMCSGIIWYLAKPAIASQFCTADRAEAIERRAEDHAAKQSLSDASNDARLGRIEAGVAKVNAQLCLLRLGPKATAVQQADCVGGAR